MQIIDNLIIVSAIILAFIAGLKLADRYNKRAFIMQKEALEKQFLRLKACADADDPCKPYIAPTGDYDGDEDRWPNPITPAFMAHLRENKQASTKFRKSDLAK